MRLWSVHPKYLDAKGLVALWREALLAQKVLQGNTRGYKHHPQLQRFKGHPDPTGAIGKYLLHIWEEGKSRGYCFKRDKIECCESKIQLNVNRGQLAYEFNYLKHKLKTRDAVKYHELTFNDMIEPHPLFIVKEGGIESWEKEKS